MKTNKGNGKMKRGHEIDTKHVSGKRYRYQISVLVKIIAQE